MKILVINGPNLQLLGTRKPEIYGTTTLSDVEAALSRIGSELSVETVFFQSNHEGAIVDRIGGAVAESVDGIVINPAAYTHTSVAIHDALESVGIPAIEVHISHIHRREEFRHRSMTVTACVGQICGLGVDGYEWALRALVKRLQSST